MFRSARIKLTSIYLLIIMFISLSFSLMIYLGVSRELERGFTRAEIRHHAQEIGIHLPRKFSLRKEDLRPELQNITPRFLFVEDLREARRALITHLFMINGLILVISAAASYAMAGKTLEPIESAMDQQKRFVADASHELRTPLTALKTSIEVALREKSLSVKQAKEVLKESLDDIDHLSSLSTKLLHLSKFQQGTDLKFSKVNLDKIVKKAVKKIQPLAKDKQIKLSTDIKKVTIKAEAEQIQEMITIFLDNAIKYTKKSGSIKVKLKNTDKKAIITISDTGIGISKEHLPNIFKRFYRATSAREKGKIDGFGLGLSLAEMIIKAHNGSVKVKSTLGKGSTFTVTLPLK